MLENLKKANISGASVFPIVEGGKGVGVSNGITAGAFAAAGAVGTFSGVNADCYDENGDFFPLVYKGKTRKERNEELIKYSIRGGIAQAKIAHEKSGGNGRIHMNVLWEMAGAEQILNGVLDGAKGLIHGITCGAGMPYKLAEIAQKYDVYYYPIVSSMRAFRALWKRSYSKVSNLLGGVVYEDPWRAGGHNGLSNAEDPNKPGDPYPRIVELRKFMNEVGLEDVPIIMAGGVWNLEEFKDWLDNPEVGPIAFQLGTRPVLTKESPVSKGWREKLLNLKEGDVYLNRFSPTGFYSSAVDNNFIKELKGREERQVEYKTKEEEGFEASIGIGPRKRPVYMSAESKEKCEKWIGAGFEEALRTPDSTLIFVSSEKAAEITKDQVDCMGCLNACRFSNWSTNEEANYTNGKKADPRSFCIQKTLQNIIHGDDVDNELMFAGTNAFNFAEDSFYDNGFVPTVQQLVDRIMEGK